MTSSLRGYTIFEVMVVLSVTLVIFISAITVFSGRQQKTQFTQTIFDFQSRLQSYATEVSSGTFPATSDYHCVASNFGSGPLSAPYWRPELLSGASTQSTSQDCVYLGKAIEVIRYPGNSNPDKNNKMFVYSVFGLRQFHPNGCADAVTGDAATTPLQACPAPAIDRPANKYILTDTYTPLEGVRIMSTKFATYANPADVLLLYSSFQTASASSQGLRAYTIGGNHNGDFSYNAPGSNDAIDTHFLACLEMQSDSIPGLGDANCRTPNIVGSQGWEACLEDSDANQAAKIAVFGTATGITTKVTRVQACS
jgi:type II secretory pathway pseudopilin PulG